VAREGLDAHQRVRTLVGQEVLVVGIHARDAIARGDLRGKLGSQLGQRHDLAVRQRGIVLQMGALTHVADTDESELDAVHGDHL